jgi:hypothetical protein
VQASVRHHPQAVLPKRGRAGHAASNSDRVHPFAVSFWDRKPPIPQADEKPFLDELGAGKGTNSLSLELGCRGDPVGHPEFL